MKTFGLRRISNLVILGVAAAVCLALWLAFDVALRSHALYSGVALLAVVLILTLFNARKKLPFLPLLKASHWLQFHIYAGLFSVVLYGVHTGFRIPNGALETGTAVLFGVVAVSGVVGLILSRSLPRRLTRSGEPLTFEKIPALETRLRKEVEAVVEQAEEEHDASAVGQLYLSHLSHYFRPRSPLALLTGSLNRQRERAGEEIERTERYVDDTGQACLDRIRECVARKHNLDLQKSGQFLLRIWLFIHIPFSYGLILAAFVHAWVALSFTSSR